MSNKKYYNKSLKPFVYIDLPKNVQREKFIPHDNFKGITGIIEFQIKVISEYIFVGSGLYDYNEKDNLVYYSFCKSNENYYIPGTSVKGSVRSVAEAISNSCVSQLAGEQKRGYKRRPKDNEKKKYLNDKSSCNKINNLCTCCRVFGTNDYAGRINFNDAYLISGLNREIVKIGELHGPVIVKSQRKFYENKKFSKTKSKNLRKNYRYVEALKKDGKFNAILQFKNLNKAELSLILYSMGIDQNYYLKIGGAKPRSFGTVEFEINKIRILNNSNLLNPISNFFEEKDLNWIKEIMENKSLINNEAFNKVLKNLDLKSEECPEGNY
ncbi:MAG: RAMP superfamily CRISPR-associated protein [Promethearchaeota archaeon]